MSTILEKLEKKKTKLSDGAKDVLLPTERSIDKKLTGLKVFIGSAFVLSLLALCGSFFLFTSLNSVKQQRSDIEASQSVILKDAEGLKDRVEQYQIVIERLREQVQNYVEERKEFRKEFERNQIEVSNLEKKLIAVEQRNSAIENQMAQLGSQRVTDFSSAVPAASSFTSSSTPSSSFSDSSSDSGIVYEEERSQASVSNTARFPQVLTVNRKFDFVVINLGLQENARIGDEIEILRSGQVIGKVQIEKLYDHFSAANIVEEGNELISEGDEIRPLS